jgi:hypothetical protein
VIVLFADLHQFLCLECFLPRSACSGHVPGAFSLPEQMLPGFPFYFWQLSSSPAYSRLLHLRKRMDASKEPLRTPMATRSRA